MADNVRMGAGGVPYKAKSEPKEEEISEVLTVNPNKAKEEKKSKDSDQPETVVNKDSEAIA